MAARRKQHVGIAASAMNAASVSVSSPSAPPTTPRALRGEPLRHDDDDDDEEDDEGDAPEEISQGVARDRAMRSLKEAEDSRKKEKADVKEKRRHKHELYKEQKKRKMLSEDILKAVDEAESRKAAGPTKAKLSGHHDDDDNDDDEEQESGKEEESAPAVENKKKAKRGSSCYRVVRLRDEGLGAQKREEAQSFLQQRLYGQGRQRVSANEFFSLRNKTGACKKPALQFVKDGGAGMNKKERKKRKREQAKTA